MRQEHDRAADRAPDGTDRRPDPVRGRGHHRTKRRRPQGAAARNADDLPGPVLLAEPAQERGLDHRRAVRDPRAAQGRGRAQEARAGADGQRRPQPRALQPLPARVLRRSAPADRGGARDRARAQAAGRRRTGVRARRLDPGPGSEPAARAAARDGPDPDLHRPRSLGRAPHVRPRGGHVPGQDRRARAQRIPVRRSRAIPTPVRCCPRCPFPIPPAGASDSCSPAMSPAPPTRPPPAAFTPVARRPARSARRTSLRSRTRATAPWRRVTSR